MKLTKAKAKKAIFNYGIYTMLIVLEHLESVQDYESCGIIVEAIKDCEVEYDWRAGTLPTKMTDNTFEELSANLVYSDMHDKKIYEDVAGGIINGKVKL